MSFNDLLIDAPSLEDAIDRNPSIVGPEAFVSDAIALMSQMQGVACSLPSPEDPADGANILQGARSSCVLVMQAGELKGIFTERDIVKLTASHTDFTGLTVTQVMAHPVITLSETGFQDIFAALFLFRRYRIRHLVIVDDLNQVIGVVSPESIRRSLRPSNLLKLRRVSDVMAGQVIHATPLTSVFALAQLMATHRVSCIVIALTEYWEENLAKVEPIGIVTERDIVQFQALGLNLEKMMAQDVMSSPLFLLSPEDSLWTAHKEMQQRRVQRLVVSWDWQAKLGIVTQTSLLRIFDPVEMYGVVETLQQTVVQLKAERDSKNDFSPLLPNPNLDRAALKTQAQLQYLLENPQLPIEVRESYLKTAIAELQTLQKSFDTPA